MQKIVKWQNIVGSFCVIVTMLLLIFGTYSLSAQETQDRNWSLAIGGVAIGKPVYSGSNKLEVMPYPFVNAEYTTTYVDLFAVGDKAGIKLKAPRLPGSHLSFGVKLGQGRDNEKEAVKDLLESMPKLENPIQLFGVLTWRTPIGELSSTVNWLPVKAEYNETERSDEEYNGLKINLDYMLGFPFRKKFFLFGGLGTTWMNADYTEAYHSVLYPTSKLKAFHAKSGMNDIHASLGAICFLSQHIGQHIGATLIFSGTQLLGDAADSPLTKNEFQPGFTTVLFYKF